MLNPDLSWHRKPEAMAQRRALQDSGPRSPDTQHSSCCCRCRAVLSLVAVARTECFLGSDLTSTPESPKASASTSTALRVRKRWCAHGQPRALENLSKSPQFKCPTTPCKQCNDVASIGLARLPHDLHDSTRPHDKKPGPCSQHNPSVPTQQRALEEERSKQACRQASKPGNGNMHTAARNCVVCDSRWDAAAPQPLWPATAGIGELPGEESKLQGCSVKVSVIDGLVQCSKTVLRSLPGGCIQTLAQHSPSVQVLLQIYGYMAGHRPQLWV